MWLDVDGVVVGDLSWAFEGAEAIGLAVRRNQIGISTTPLVARAGLPAMSRWIRRQEAILRALKPGEELLPWTALGATSLTEAVGDDLFFELPAPRVAPLSWTEADSYLSRFIRPDVALRPEASMINLYNERFPQWLKVASNAEILASPIMLARLLRIALGESTRAGERRAFDPLGAALESAASLAIRLGRFAGRQLPTRGFSSRLNKATVMGSEKSATVDRLRKLARTPGDGHGQRQDTTKAAPPS